MTTKKKTCAVCGHLLSLHDGMGDCHRRLNTPGPEGAGLCPCDSTRLRGKS